MKQFLLIYFLVLAFSGSAQSPYKPFLNNSAWLIETGSFFGSTQTWYYGTDTVVNNIPYQKIQWGGTSFHLVREDVSNRKVYIKRFNAVQEILLYDFSITTIGSPVTINIWNNNPLSCTLYNLDSVMTNDGYRRQFTYKFAPSNVYFTILEGIGSTYEPFRILNPNGDPHFTLYCTYQNNQHVYNWINTFTCPPNPLAVNANSDQVQRKSLSVYPNPASEILQVEIPEGAEEMVLTLTDIMGRNVRSQKVQAGSTAGINTALFSNGTYVVSVQTSGALYRAKAIIAR